MKGRVVAEIASFILLLIGRLVMMASSRFPVSPHLWWIAFAGFIAVFILELAFITPPNHAKKLIKERDNARKELDRIRDYQLARRRRARKACLEHCVEIYSKVPRPSLLIGALWRADGHKLATNEDLVWVCDQLEQRGHGNPFSASAIPPEKWLTFLEDAKLAGKNLSDDAAAALDAFQEWGTTGQLNAPWRIGDSENSPPSPEKPSPLTHSSAE